jgi:DNA polymerase delta subunit 4
MTSAKNSSSRNGSAPLKQGTLSFSSAKRTNSNTTAKTKKPPPPPARRSSSALEKEKERVDDAIHLGRHDEEHSDDVLEMSSDEEHLPGRAIASTRSRTAAGKSALPDTTKASAKRVKEDPPAVKPVEQRPSLDVTAKKYRKHYGQVREKMGNLEPSEYHNICAFCPTCGAKTLTRV